MDDQDSSNNRKKDGVISPHPGWLVERIKSKLHKRSAENNQKNAVDRAATSTARATWAIAVLTAVTIGVGWSQYRIFDRQLTAMEGQLAEMKGTGVQTNAIIETNKKLAEAAGVQAKAAIDSAKTAQENLVAGQRAWVGPRNAKSDIVPEIGKALNITIEYQNTGREPALETISDTDVFAGEDSTETASKINNFIDQCKIKWTPTQKGVVFPSGATSSAYELNISPDSSIIDQDVIDGTKMLFIDGCFIYKSAGGIHRTSFCFFFSTAKKTKPTNWNICAVGNDAD